MPRLLLTPCRSGTGGARQPASRPMMSGNAALLPDLLLVVWLLLGTAPAWGLTLSSSSPALSGPGWQAEQIELTLQLGISSTLHLTIGELTLPEPAPVLVDVRLDCPQLHYQPHHWQCAELRITGQDLEAQGTLSYRPHTGALDLQLDTLHWQHQRLQVTLAYQPQRWTLSAELHALSLPAAWLQAVDLQTLEGDFSGRVQLQGDATGLRQAEGRLRARRLNFASADGRRAGEGLQLGLNGHWRLQRGFEMAAQLCAGELYIEPLYWNRQAAPASITLDLRGDWRDGRLRLEHLRFHHPEVVQVEGSLLWQPQAEPALRRLAVQMPPTDLQPVYTHYLQPLAFGTLLDNVHAGGRIAADLVLEQHQLTALNLDLYAIDLEEAEQRFAVQGLFGRLSWGGEATTRLGWQAAGIHQITIGAAELPLQTRPGQIELTAPSRIPVLDGSLLLQQLVVAPQAEVQAQFGGRLEGLSMAAVSAALNWPPLSGSLSGVIPRVRYWHNHLDIDGALLVKAFDGDITVANLRLDRPFETLPELTADIELFNLDLSSITQTFDIGRMEGLLSGYVRDLRLLDWRPVEFDAYLHTPEGDTSRRRISQRAVESISDLGGTGAAGALSRLALGLFEDFHYARLGIGCRLQGGICTLRGLAPSADGQGFQLVQGRGLPRIDIVGYNTRVDWNDLLTRLQAAMLSEGAIVE